MAGARIVEQRVDADGAAVRVLRVEGDLDAEGFLPLERGVREALLGVHAGGEADAGADVVLDGSRIGYASSAALVVLCRLARRARRRGRRFRVAAPSARLREVLEVLRLQGFPVDDTVEEALAALRAKRRAS